MNWAITKNGKPILVEELPAILPDELGENLSSMFAQGKRLALFFGVPDHGENVLVYTVFADDDNSRLFIARTLFPPTGGSYQSLSAKYPCLNLFEREVYEDTGVTALGHPAPNPIRRIFDNTDSLIGQEHFNFSKITGDGHEVGVGPVHAGIIEPGHFRFSCLGEKIHLLEAHLGYQHRGIERLFCQNDMAQKLMPLAESIAGDTVIGHGLACAELIEALTGTEIPARARVIRGIALELERAAIHTGDLAALAADIAYLPGNAVFGTTRTILINSLLAICGSRFGRSLVCEGGVGFDVTPSVVELVKKNCAIVRKRIERACAIMFSAPSVLSRFESTGIVTFEDARSFGLVGPAARASGVGLDIRSDHPSGIYAITPVHKITMQSGDVFARAYLRYVEIIRSLSFIEELVDNLPAGDIRIDPAEQPAPSSLVVTLVEGWRGEIAHCAITSPDGSFMRYKIKDPSFNNWPGLELAVRGNGISDFPVCNKSFNLSYCGFDL